MLTQGPGRPAAVGGIVVALATVVVGVVPGTAAGWLVGALGASGQAGGDPGVPTVLPGSIALAALATYLVAFVAAALLLVGHRDLA